MILNNTQANIFKVNGGIADNFANRPTANGSFYIFYSLDTQEIFYDSGTWVLIGTGNVPASTNIYNSDGTLTANRTLSGGNNDLNFSNLNIFKTISQGNDIGLKLDFANDAYYFGDFNGITLNSYIVVDNANSIFRTQNQGLKVDFNNSIYYLGDFSGLNNNTNFIIDDINQIIKTSYQGNDIGLKLDFANRSYQLGQLNAGSQTYLTINDISTIIKTECINAGPGGDAGIYIDFSNGIYNLGDYNLGINGTSLLIEDNSTQIIKTSNQGNEIGLKLDFANRSYQLGQLTGGNKTSLIIDDSIQSARFSNNNFANGLALDFLGSTYYFGQLLPFGISGSNQTNLLINDGQQIITANNKNLDNGLYLNFSQNEYRLGDWNVTPNRMYLSLRNQSNLMQTIYNNINVGFNLNFAAGTRIYQFGEIVGANQNFLSIVAVNNGGTALQLAGNSFLSNTSGANSGQHLKIVVNGVQYKIELKNP